MNRDLLKQVIADQRELALPQNYFTRTQSPVIRRLVDNPSIIIISGLRRAGKSTILKHLQSQLDESDYYFNFDDDRLVQFTAEDFQMLLEVFIELFGVQKIFYFDEIQNILGWEVFVRRLHDYNNKIFITGSNASLLSRELGTRLTGRFIPVEVFPLSFQEILENEQPTIINKKLLTTTDVGLALRTFSKYLQLGGIPEFVKFRNTEYLRSLYENILYRDIIVRHGINEKPIKELAFYLASNVGKEFSYNNLAKVLGIGSSNTVSNYCGFLEDCYLFFFLSRYSHSLQKQMYHHKKCYMIDPALIRLIGFRVSEDKGRLLENIVFLHLRQREDEIFFHKNKKECDFVVRKANKIHQAIQVTSSMHNPQIKERELEGLLEAMEDYQLDEGLILTENDEAEMEIASSHSSKKFMVKILPIWKWLLKAD